MVNLSKPYKAIHMAIVVNLIFSVMFTQKLLKCIYINVISKVMFKNDQNLQHLCLKTTLVLHTY